MESMSTRWRRLGAAVLALAAGCSGLSTVEAEQRCDQERTADGTGCIDDEAYDACVSCYEDCGDDCARGNACPASFSCPE
jgi:hypothetical protein